MVKVCSKDEFQNLKKEMETLANERRQLFHLGFDITGGEVGLRNNNRMQRRIKAIEARLRHINNKLVSA